jgi:hypothetical protein
MSANSVDGGTGDIRTTLVLPCAHSVDSISASASANRNVTSPFWIDVMNARSDFLQPAFRL